MPRKKATDGAIRGPIQIDAFNVQELLTTAPCVPAIREVVSAWRRGGYKGTTATTAELLNFWFQTDHVLPGGIRFRYHTAQREAIETLIYVVEVANIKSRTALLEKYAMAQRGLQLPTDDGFARFAIKMATGSGKTKVMSMVVVWQYANAIREGRDDYARTFLILAPNVIVFDRLKSDFGDGRIFKTDPLIPRHFGFWWEMDYYVRGDSERGSSDGAVYLTNIQQFYERPARTANAESDIMTDILGSAPQTTKVEVSDFAERIAARPGPVLVLNDEAHHTHDETGEWNKFIRHLHGAASGDFTGVNTQLDFSATPRFTKGTLFPWIISDYPLKQAILDRIVKRPLKGISQIEEAKSDIASVRYKGFLTAGVERWKEYTEQLNDLNKKPLLFVMMNNTKEADDVGVWLRERFPEHFGGEKLLIIHTNQSGDIAKNDLDKSRELARDVDKDTSPVNAIVSVLMLREGWDVQNVTVVVGLRPYSSKANILPEQTIGRGLRLMFRNLVDGSFQERVDIIGNKAFMAFVEDLEKLEDFKLDSFQLGKDKLKIITIQPLADKAAVDIGLPVITPLLDRKKSLAEEIAGLDVMAFRINALPLKGKDLAETKTFIYEGRDILTNEKLIEKRYEIPPAQTAEEVLGYYARRIAQDIKLPSQFAALVPKLREFFSQKAFGVAVENLNEPGVIRAMSGNLANHIVVNEFRKALRDLIVEAKTPELVLASRLLSETLPFPFSRKLAESAKTVFNYAACDNEFEWAFARFLGEAEEVEAFAKLPESFGFCIQYTDAVANIRNYYPDFVARLLDGSHWLLETKGREDVEVRLKDNAALNWCDAATTLTGVSWQYMKVLQKDFENLKPDSFTDLQMALMPPTLF